MCLSSGRTPMVMVVVDVVMVVAVVVFVDGLGAASEGVELRLD